MTVEKRLEDFLESVIRDISESWTGNLSAENMPSMEENFDHWLALSVGDTSLLCPDQTQLTNIIKASRRIWLSSEIYRNATRNRKNFILGQFVSFDLLPEVKDKYDVDKLVDALRKDRTIRKLNRNWSAFWKRNKMLNRLHSWVEKLDRDGTAYFRIFRGGEVPDLRFIDPLTVGGVAGDVAGQPEGTSNPFSLGIITDAEDVEDFKGLIVRSIDSSGTYADSDFVPAEDIIRVTAGADFDSLVGIPRFWPVFTNIRRAEKILNNSSVLTQIQTAIAMIRKHEHATSARISGFANRNATGSRTNTATGSSERTRYYGAGTILDAKNGTSYDFPAHKVNPESWNVPIHEELARVAAVGHIPTAWLLAQENENPLNPGSPYIRNFAVERSQLFESLEDLYWRVQEEMGVEVERVRDSYDLQINAPAIPTAKALDQARVDDIYMKQSAKSVQQICRENGTGYLLMRAEVLAHRETRQEDEQFPGDAGMTNLGGDGETKKDGNIRKAAGDGGDQR